MQNPLMNDTGSSSGQTRVGDGWPGHGRDKVENVKIRELKGQIVINGENFLAHVHDQFNKQAAGSFLTNEIMCQSDPARSHAFVTHLRESIKEHANLSYLDRAR